MKALFMTWGDKIPDKKLRKQFYVIIRGQASAEKYFMLLLFILLLFSITASGQDSFSLKDSSVVKTVEGLPNSEPFDTTHSYHRVTKPFVYIISDKDLYDLFSYEIAMRFYQFNFTDYHILGILVCKECLLYCRHDEGEANCHRNRCMKEWTWLMRENKIAFTEIPSAQLKGHIEISLPKGRTHLFGDTVTLSKENKSLANWYTTGHGDCFAHFEYKVYKDNFHPVILLKEWNHWGGCRAGGSWEYTISFPMPDGILQYSKNIILAEKYKDNE